MKGLAVAEPQDFTKTTPLHWSRTGLMGGACGTRDGGFVVRGPPQSAVRQVATVGGVSRSSPVALPPSPKKSDDNPKVAADLSENLDAEKQKENLVMMALGFGYIKEDVDDAVKFFDFSLSKVKPKEFFSVVDEVHANKKKLGGADDAALAKDDEGEDKEGEDLVGIKKSGKKKKKKKSGDGGAAQPGAATLNGLTSRGLSPHAGGKTVEQQGSRSQEPVGPPRGSLADDSIIFMEEEMPGDRTLTADSDASVLLVDAFSPRVNQSPPIIKPTYRGAGGAAGLEPISLGVGHKRKPLFSDDEEQTSVLRPYNQPSTSQASGLAQPSGSSKFMK
jgi:hypothetical protein